jgi:hypothetical protein
MSTRRAERHGAAHAPSGPAAERRRIVASKLAGPPLGPGIVDRPLLLDGLASSIFRLRDGKIIQVWSLEDTLGRLQQLGLT